MNAAIAGNASAGNAPAGNAGPVTHCHSLVDQGDMLGFYNCFLRKLNKTSILEDNLILNEGETASLMVIDMQNDFILSPFVAGGTGRFSVQNGLSVIEPLVNFINTNAKKFNKIIFSRDMHPIDHCSFFTIKGQKAGKEETGPFPPHCVINHIGAALHESFLQFKSLPNAEVIFKGCNNTTDSFGAFDYKADNYLTKRQRGSCCADGNCAEHTGGNYITNKNVNRQKAFENFPFDSISKYTDDSKEILTTADCPQALTTNIQNELGDKFKLEDILPENIKNKISEKKHYIFVTGLAGDFCVKDTAINLMKEVEAKGYKVQVKVIQPFTRYAFLPVSLIDFTNSMEKNYKNIKVEKDINNYLFKPTFYENAPPTFKLFNKDQLKNINYKEKAAIFSFLTPMKELIEDYSTADVQIVMTVPNMDNVMAMAGGRRKRNNRNNRRKATRKQNNRKRQTYRRRR